jgi:hypothetical protein
MTTAIAAGGALVLADGAPGRLAEETRSIAAFSVDYHDRVDECFWRKTDERSWLEPCLYGTGEAPARVALWGDSHGPSTIPALDAAAAPRGLSVALYAHNGCPPIDGFRVYWAGQNHDCAPFLEETYPAVLGDPALELVVIVLRAPIYTEGWLPHGLVERDRTKLLVGGRDGPLPPGADRVAFFLDGLEATVAALREAGKEVALVYPLPEAGFEVPDGMVRLGMRGRDAAPGVPRTEFDARTAPIVAGYDRIVERHGAIPVRLDRALCDEAACALVRDGVPLFRDSNHLNATSARGLAPFFGPALDTVAPEAAGARPAETAPTAEAAAAARADAEAAR